MPTTHCRDCPGTSVPTCSRRRWGRRSSLQLLALSARKPNTVTSSTQTQSPHPLLKSPHPPKHSHLIHPVTSSTQTVTSSTQTQSPHPPSHLIHTVTSSTQTQSPHPPRQSPHPPKQSPHPPSHLIHPNPALAGAIKDSKVSSDRHSVNTYSKVSSD